MSAPFDTNAYNAMILRHIDGDTTVVEIACGFDVRIRMTVRWAGIDAPERFTDGGKYATSKVNEWLPVGSICQITTMKDSREKYGRYLATFYDAAGVNLNTRMITEGIAVLYNGGPR